MNETDTWTKSNIPKSIGKTRAQKKTKGKKRTDRRKRREREEKDEKNAFNRR